MKRPNPAFESDAYRRPSVLRSISKVQQGGDERTTQTVHFSTARSERGANAVVPMK